MSARHRPPAAHAPVAHAWPAGFSLLTLLLAGLLAGCEVPQPPPAAKNASPPEPKYVDPDSDEGRRLAAARAEAAAQPVSAPRSESPQATDPTSAAPEKTGRVVEAKAGVGKWKPYQPGLVTTPLNAYFSVQESIKFKQVTHELKLFHASNGRKPRDFAEVERKILKPAAITLPQLAEGDQYVYVPNEGPDGSLMVMRAAPQ